MESDEIHKLNQLLLNNLILPFIKLLIKDLILMAEKEDESFYFLEF